MEVPEHEVVPGNGDRVNPAPSPLGSAVPGEPGESAPDLVPVNHEDSPVPDAIYDPKFGARLHRYALTHVRTREVRWAQQHQLQDLIAYSVPVGLGVSPSSTWPIAPMIADDGLYMDLAEALEESKDHLQEDDRGGPASLFED